MRLGPSARSLSIVRKTATRQMLQTCRVERVTKPGYDPATLVATPGGRTTIYEGRCRIWEQASPSMVQISETTLLAYQTVLSLPWETAGVALMDEFEILTSPTDSEWVGGRFRIETLKEGGQLRPTRSFVVTRITPRVSP